MSLPPSFLTPTSNFCILSALVGFTSFVESFVAKAFHEDFETIFNFPMLVDLHAIFMILSLYYTQCFGYLFCIVFSSPSILQLYIKFDTCTIVTLEKLLNVGSFGGFISHLAHC